MGDLTLFRKYCDIGSYYQKSDFRRYSIQENDFRRFQRKCDCFRRYSSDIQCFQILLYQNTVILDVIAQIE